MEKSSGEDVPVARKEVTLRAKFPRARHDHWSDGAPLSHDVAASLEECQSSEQPLIAAVSKAFFDVIIQGYLCTSQRFSASSKLTTHHASY